MDYMTDVIDRLEKWRLTNGLSKIEMAKLLGCNSKQQYSNWVSRNSLPKSYFRRAADILGDSMGNVAPLKSSEVKTKPGVNYESSAFKQLTDEEKDKLVLRLLSDLSADGRVKALRFLLRDE